MNRKNNYNLLRLKLAICVILCHNIEFLNGNRKNEIFTVLFKTTMSLGDFSVNLFFLISGFLIVKSWDLNKSANLFLLNRILRIYPGFIVACIFSCFMIGPFSGNTCYFQNFNYYDFIFNLFILKIPITPIVFTNNHIQIINGSLWTINNEFICYLLVFFIGITSFSKFKNTWILFFTLLFSFLYFAYKFDLKFINNFFSNYLVVDFFEKRLVYTFFIGGTYYLFIRNHLNKVFLIIISAICFFVCLLNNLIINYSLPIFEGYLIFSFAEKVIPKLSSFNKLPDISYGLYLYGWPISNLLIHFQPNINYWILNIESLFISILLGLLSWYLIEKPFLSLKKSKIPIVNLNS